MSAREFTVAGEYIYDRRSPVRWIISHILRYPWLPAFTLLGNICSSGASCSRICNGSPGIVRPAPSCAACASPAMPWREAVPIRQEILGPRSPASTLVAVAALAHPDFLIEIEAVAVL